MNAELIRNHVWKDFSKMGNDSLKYICSYSYAHYFNWLGIESC